MNTIRFVVRNDDSGNNPVALRLEGKVEARAVGSPEPPPGLLDNDTYPSDGPADPAVAAIPGVSNPWLAGMPDGASASVFDHAPEQSPVSVVGIAVVPGAPLFISADGGVSSGAEGGKLYGPDGSPNYVQHGVGDENGLSSVYAPLNSLIGVFLGPSAPDGSPAPTRLDFRPATTNVPNGVDYGQLSPTLKQTFFIGDGKTSDGTPQQIIVPAGATRLFLGVMDSGASSNNLGSLQVTFDSPAIIPTTAVLDEGPQHGEVTLSEDGVFRYRPQQDYIGDDSFRYHIASRKGDSNVATVSLTVQPPSTPTAVDDLYAIGQGLPLQVGEPRVVKDLGTGIRDLDGSKLTGLAPDEDYRIGIGSPEGSPGAAATVIPGEVPWGNLVPDAASQFSRWIGVSTLTEGVFDAYPGTFYFETTVNLTGYEAASAYITGFRWAADNTLTAVLVNGQLAYATQPRGPIALTDPVNIGQGLFQPGANIVRFVVNNYEVTGGNPLALRVEGRVVAQPSGQPPSAALLSNDQGPRGQTLTAELVAAPVHGSLDLRSDGTFDYVPSPSFVGADEFTYRARNGASASPPATVRIQIAARNTIPTAVDDQYSVQQGALSKRDKGSR
ncbi:MAG: Ig-like domain-containing protein [Pirellulales bacterium]